MDAGCCWTLATEDGSDPPLSEAELQKLKVRTSLTESVHKGVLQKSIPAQICQLILHIRNNKGSADGFVRQLTFCKTTLQTLSVS